MGELIAISPPLQALLAGAMTWALTALGAAAVLLMKRPRPWLMDAMLAFGAGVMLAASFFSLLSPAVELASMLRQAPFVIVPLSFLFGGSSLIVADACLSRRLAAHTVSASHRRTALLIASITLHNIPEGLAIGVAFGAAGADPTAAVLSAAWMLAMGVGLQNLPEGAAVSLPLHREGLSPIRSFFWGQTSALVEPIAALFGAVMAMHVRPVLPFTLAFAAGAMITVVVSDLLPESQRSIRPAMMTFFTLLGFAVMMVLDAALG